MSDANTSDYDARVQAIRAYNQPLLDDFEVWLEQLGLSEQTIQTHVDNIDFFTNYLAIAQQTFGDKACHPERSEGSGSPTERSFASLRMTGRASLK